MNPQQEQQEPSNPEDMSPNDPEKKNAEDMLDALKDQERALKRKRLIQKIKPKQVEKDW